MDRNLNVCKEILFILTFAILFIGTVAVEGRGQEVTAERLAKCRALNSKNTKLGNELLDVERKNKIEAIDFQIQGQNGVLAQREADLKQVRAGRITPSMQEDRISMASELGLRWDDRWNLDYVSYYEAIIKAHKEEIKEMESKILDLKDSMGSEPPFTGVDLILRHKELKKELTTIDAEMETLRCGEVLESDRVSYEEKLKNSERERFLADLKVLETQVNATAARGNRLKGFVTDAVRLSNDARNAAALAGEILIGFTNIRRGELSQLSINAAKNKCALAQRSPYEIDQEVIDLRRKADVLQASLQNATAQANTCTSKEQAEAIEEKYRTAVKLLAEIGAIERAAAQRRVALETARQGVVDGKPLIQAAQNEVGRIVAEKKRVNAYRTTVNTNISDATSIADGIRGEAKVLLAEYVRLSQEYTRLFLPNIGDQTRALVVILKSRIGGLLTAAVPEDLLKYKSEIGARELEIEALTQRGQALLKQYEEAFCDLKIFDDAIAKANSAIADIAGVVRKASFDVGLSSDLPQKAKICVNRAACESLAGELRAAINSNNINLADGLIARAKGLGCDTSGLKADLDARSERDAFDLINLSKQNCRFQQAVDLTAKIPSSIQAMPRVSQAIAEARAGLQAQQRIEQLIDSADKASSAVAAASFISQARAIASPYPCLAADFVRVSDGKASRPIVEALPEDTHGRDQDPVKPTSTISRRKIESIPEDNEVVIPHRPNSVSKSPPKQVLDELEKAINDSASGIGTPQPRPTRESNAGVNPSPAGSLPAHPVWIKSGRTDYSGNGTYNYIFSGTVGTRHNKFPANEGGESRWSWSFSGVPTGSLQPGQEYRISVTGNFTTSLAPTDLNPPASGGVTLTGDVDIIKRDHAYISKTMGRPGEYVFRVRPNAKSVTIELWGDYGISTFARYKFGAQ